MKAQQVKEAADFIRQRALGEPAVGIVLGSGLGALAETVENPVRIPYAEIPHFPVSSVAGHAGVMHLGRLGGQAVAVMQGRIHHYEGFSGNELVFPVRVLHELGIGYLVLSNSAGGINPAFEPGDLMVVTDHINFMGFNPLLGVDSGFGPRFPDLSAVYPAELRRIARATADRQGVSLREGVYLAVSGPSYETPAEIRLFRQWGADAVGMSTVPEAIAAAQLGLPVLCISCITNKAAGLQEQPLSHQEVLDISTAVSQNFIQLLLEIVECLP
ncbi:MAG: purine-nucleoside phosphorylase [Acidobacteria bacterium]|nr:purine-nucleoside phosphorylase [Acidobacteriota bacterium]